MESTYDTSDHKPRDEDLRIFSKEGRSSYNTPENTNRVRIIVVEINRQFYDLDDRIETEESIRRILVIVDLKDSIEELYNQIDVKLNPKP